MTAKIAESYNSAAEEDSAANSGSDICPTYVDVLPSKADVHSDLLSDAKLFMTNLAWGFVHALFPALAPSSFWKPIGKPSFFGSSGGSLWKAFRSSVAFT